MRLFVLLTCASTVARAQSFSLASSDSIRQPQRIVLAADGSRITYVLGDTLFVARGSDGGQARPIAGGMRTAAGTARPFHAVSPHGERIVFLTGDGSERAMVADLSGPTRVRPLLPDSLGTRLMFFQHFAAGGPSWSPDARHVAFLAADRASGEPLQLFIADVHNGTARRIASDGRMHYSVAFSPDGKWLAYSVQGDSAGSVAIELLTADGVPARRIGLLRARYVTDLLWSPSGDNLAVYAANGATTVFDIRSPSATVKEIPGRHFAGWTAAGAGLLGTRRDGMSTRLVHFALASGVLTDLSGGDTLFSTISTASVRGRTILLHTMESGDLPRDVFATELVRTGVSRRVRFTNANAWLHARMPGTSRVFRWHVSDGRVMEAQLFVPPTRGPHPLVVMPYGGYQNAFPSSEYFLDAGTLPLLANGFAVVRPNTRGQASEDAPPGDYGSIQLRDTEAMLDSLVAEHVIEPAHVAVLGHSHGGSMAYYYDTHSARFCGVVAVNGRADWEMQATRGDGYLVAQMGGMPDSIPDVYRRASPLRNVARATTPLLAITGMKDTQIYPANGSSIVAALRALGKSAELLEYADEGHLIAAHRASFWNSVMSFLQHNCR